MLVDISALVVNERWSCTFGFVVCCGVSLVHASVYLWSLMFALCKGLCAHTLIEVSASASLLRGSVDFTCDNFALAVNAARQGASTKLAFACLVKC